MACRGSRVRAKKKGYPPGRGCPTKLLLSGRLREMFYQLRVRWQNSLLRLNARASSSWKCIFDNNTNIHNPEKSRGSPRSLSSRRRSGISPFLTGPPACATQGHPRPLGQRRDLYWEYDDREEPISLPPEWEVHSETESHGGLCLFLRDPSHEVENMPKERVQDAPP